MSPSRGGLPLRACTEARTLPPLWVVLVLAVPGALSLHLRSDESKPAGGKATSAHRALYNVQVNFDIEEFDPTDGVTMHFAKDSHEMRLDKGIAPAEAIAWGHYDDKIAASGWSELYMETSERQDLANEAKVYAAGFAEGILTCVRMSEFYGNTFRLLLKKEESWTSLAAIKNLLTKELGYVRSKTNMMSHVLADEPSDPYWKQIRFVLVQLWGICDGYNYAARHFGVHTFGLLDMMMLNSGAELPQMMDAYGSPGAGAASFLQLFRRNASGLHRQTAAHSSALRGSPTAAVREDALDDAHWEHRIAGDGRCSAFVRVTKGNEDILVGHTTWDDYSRMTRVFKYYKFPLTGSGAVATHIGFSSYPGVVSSTDDFYVLNSGLAIMETSLEVLDPTVWAALKSFKEKPKVPAFAHVMAVNRLARSAAQWVELYKAKGVVAYSAQWLAVDYNLFEKGSPVPDNTLWMIEEVAGLVHTEDMSEKLRTDGYFPSFNRPYFKELRDVSGHTAAEASHGALYSWTGNPRAVIFKESAGGTNLLYEMRKLMSRNLSPTRPGHDISARMDLAPDFTPVPNGGIDAKVTNRCLMKKMEVQAVSGPSHGGQPVFEWINSTTGLETWPEWPHIGQPIVWNFGFVQMTPIGTAVLSEGGIC